MPAEEKAAYVARLVKSLALAYGISYAGETRRYRERAGEEPTTPAALLRGSSPTSPGCRPRRRALLKGRS